MDLSNSYFGCSSCNLIFTLIIGGIIYCIAKFYYKTKQYPSGPFPLPILGNFLSFINLKVNAFEHFFNLSKIYGPVYTFWMSSTPFVVISDLKTANEGFLIKRNEIAGRVQIKFFKKLFDESGSVDITFNDYGPAWESLRRVAHAAVRKYSNQEKLALLVKDLVSETVDNIIKLQGIGKPFVPFDYLYLCLLNILASSAFGVKYSISDKEFLKLKSILEDFQTTMNKILAGEYLPFLRLFYKDVYKKIELNSKEFTEFARTKYKQHKSDYQDGIIRDFTDALISSQLDALKNDKESAPYLIDSNLATVINQLFLAGTDTSNHTLRWALLLMANYPSMQTRMREEIDDKIGDRIPVQDDKNNCHYINAFISECLRHRIVAPMALPHKTLCHVEINGYKIPKDTTVILHTYGIMHDPDVFDSPESFKPERFIDSNGSYLSTRHPGFVPFGMGRRVCLGEKLALADLFLIIANLLQSTSGYQFVLPDGPGTVSLTPDPNAMFCQTQDYKIMLIKAI